MTQPGVSPYSLAFPVFGGMETSRRVFDASRGVLGTSFLLGEGYLLTAGHVATSARDSGLQLLVGLPEPGSDQTVHVMQTLEVESLEPDVAIIQVGVKRSPIPKELEVVFQWRKKSVVELDDVWTLGFAHGTQLLGDRTRLIQRLFKGHVVADLAAYERPGQRTAFPAYELSFQAPRGLSGAPLLAGSGTKLRDIAVAGLIIGNSSMSMLVHSAEFVEESDSGVVREKHFESLTLALALQASQILELKSSLLGKTIGDYVDNRGRLTP